LAPDRASEVESLLAAAKRDALAFELLAAQPGAPDEVLFFLAQQAMEKSMKSVLAHRAVAYRKTHDLVELAALLGDAALARVVPQDVMIRLGPYAVQMRYVNVATPALSLAEVSSAVVGVLSWSEAARSGRS